MRYLLIIIAVIAIADFVVYRIRLVFWKRTHPSLPHEHEWYYSGTTQNGSTVSACEVKGCYARRNSTTLKII